jgi:Cytochrome c7 and related cytochrome c
LALVVGGLAAFFAGLMVWARTPYARGTFEPVEQPIQFDHRHHTRDDGIDCRYCHNTVEVSSYAGIPPTELCLNCHAQIWNTSPQLEQVRRSFLENVPVRWRRVHKVAEFAYFNHANHVGKGVGCVTCHGRVDQMAAVAQVAPLTMGWCLECHRNPGPHLRPRSEITNMEWRPQGDPAGLARELVASLDVATRTSCSTCHR